MIPKNDQSRKISRFLLLPLIIIILFISPMQVLADTKTTSDALSMSLSSASAVLMEANSGILLYEKSADTKLPMASVTKIMTLDLIFDAIESGKIKLSDSVTVSAHAASMGGSQVFLEEGEVQSVEDLISCISIASANDASVAMAEYIAGSEEAFVAMMNEKAASLGMENTHFINCCGLDVEGHYSSAKDIALMSRDLIINHPEIHDYCTIWSTSIYHETRRGKSEFVLSNTNKLIRQYEYCTGLKTGSTSDAGFCLSATAKKDGLSLIAVVLNSPSSKERFADAVSLFQHGFAEYQVYTDTDPNKHLPPTIPLKKGKTDKLSIGIPNSNMPTQFSTVLKKDQSIEQLRVEVDLPEEINAPILNGSKIGTLKYQLNGTTLGTLDIISLTDALAQTYVDCVKKLWCSYLPVTVTAPSDATFLYQHHEA